MQNINSDLVLLPSKNNTLSGQRRLQGTAIYRSRGRAEDVHLRVAEVKLGLPVSCEGDFGDRETQRCYLEIGD